MANLSQKVPLVHYRVYRFLFYYLGLEHFFHRIDFGCLLHIDLPDFTEAAFSNRIDTLEVLYAHL